MQSPKVPKAHKGETSNTGLTGQVKLEIMDKLGNSGNLQKTSAIGNSWIRDGKSPDTWSSDG